jgi:hypothetical protein
VWTHSETLSVDPEGALEEHHFQPEFEELRHPVVRYLSVRRLHAMETNHMKIAFSNICTANRSEAIGSKIVNDEVFCDIVCKAIEAFDFAACRVPGQGFIHLPKEANASVSAGVGLRSTDPKDFVLREHRGIVTPYLKREFAAPVTGVALVVYTREAYTRDPDVTSDEVARLGDATHVIVAVLAYAGPESSPLPPYRLVWNLAGGNLEALTYTADEIRAKAKAAIEYDNLWVTVAD